MRSYLDVVIDLKEGKEVSKQEIGLALLFAADQIVFDWNDINKLLENDVNKQPLLKQLMITNRNKRFEARKNPLDKWFGDNIPEIK